jgi:hypothetical protein
VESIPEYLVVPIMAPDGAIVQMTHTARAERNRTQQRLMLSKEADGGDAFSPETYRSLVIVRRDSFIGCASF